MPWRGPSGQDDVDREEGHPIDVEADLALVAARFSPDILVVLDDLGTIRWASEAGRRVLGRTPADAVGLPMLDFVHPDDAAVAVGAAVEAARRPGYHMPVRVRISGAEGTWIECDVNSEAITTDAGTWLVLGVRTIADHGVIADRRSRIDRLIRRASVDCSRVRWHEVGQLVDRFLEDLGRIVGADRVELAWAGDDNAGRDGGGHDMVIEASWPRSAGGEVRSFTSLWPDDTSDSVVLFTADLASMAPTVDRDRLLDAGMKTALETRLSGGPSDAVLRMAFDGDGLGWDDANADVVSLLAATLMSTSRRCEVEEQLHERARRDPMTGLFHREELYRVLSDLLEADFTAHRLGILYGDIDHFKRVNDRFGHAEGDRLVLGVAAALRANVRDRDLVARFGGDEFVVVCPDLVNEDQLAGIAARVEAAVSSLSPSGMPVRISFGSAMASAGMDADDLLKAADDSMYERKRSRDTAV